MHHLTCGISSLLHSVNLILFTVLLVHLILRISPHHSHHLCSHHLSLPRLFTADVKFVRFTNPFLHSLSGSIRTAVTDFGLGLDFLGTGHCFSLVMVDLRGRGPCPQDARSRHVTYELKIALQLQNCLFFWCEGTITPKISKSCPSSYVLWSCKWYKPKSIVHLTLVQLQLHEVAVTGECLQYQLAICSNENHYLIVLAWFLRSCWGAYSTPQSLSWGVGLAAKHNTIFALPPTLQSESDYGFSFFFYIS